MNRQPRALLSVLLLAVAVFVGYRMFYSAPADDSAGTAIVISDKPTSGGTLTSSLRTEPRSFNRVMARDTPADLFSHMAGGKLLRVNRATQEVEPSIAESWTTSADQKTFTLTLRDGVKWSDGTPFTSADVLFTFDAIYNTKPESALASGLRIDGKPLTVTAPDAKTVIVSLPSTFGPGIAVLDNVHLVAKHKYEALFKAGKFAEAMSAATPAADIITLGPFRLASYVSGQRLTFERNPHYWKKDAAGVQLPYLDQVVFEIVPDQNAELVRLQAGQLDTLQQQVRLEDLATLRPLEKEGKVKIVEVGVNADPDIFFFNLRAPYWAKDPRREWITRKEFRQAISHAIDREMYANTVYLGAGVPIWGPITTGNKNWFSPNVKRYPFSQDKAKELLAGIGLANRDADEWLEDAKGTEAAFNVIAFRGNTSVEKGAQILRDELKKIGVRVDVVLLEQGALVQKMVGGDFESIFFIVGSTSLDPAMNSDFWLSRGSAHVWNMAQETPATDWEKKIDDLMGVVMTNTDQAERKKAFDEVQDVFAENLPAIYFVAPRLYMGVSSRVGGLTPGILRPQLLWDIEHMTVSGGR